jgi:hypothetical protein
MGWVAGPNRFLTGNRGWRSRRQFQPLKRVEHAFQLLEKAAAIYTLAKSADGTLSAVVCIAGRRGSASCKSDAATITLAIAKAIGLNVPDDLMEMPTR